mgnify:CR=1 FL=1
MRKGDVYVHFKGGEYLFDGIALPITEFVGNKHELKPVCIAHDAHTPKGENIKQVQLYEFNGLMLVDRETAHVVYQVKIGNKKDNFWIREIDDFFGYKEVEKDEYIKRFTKQ